MNPALVVMDMGDVLIRTAPMAQYRALADVTGRSWQELADRIETSGAVASFQTGRISIDVFVDAVRSAARVPDLSDAAVRGAWNAVLVGVDPVMAAPARRLAKAGRLLLASNTDPLHWQVARRWLNDASIVADAVLSFDIGSAKPAAEFFAALPAADPRAAGPALYVDDRVENVEAATRHGLTGWHHQDPAGTAARLCGVLS